MEDMPYEIIEIIGWYSWRAYGDMKSVIRFLMVSKTINAAVHGAQIAPILRHMAMFKPVINDINMIIHFVTRSFQRADRFKKVISGIIHNNVLIYHTYYSTVSGDKTINDELIYYNISKDTLGGIEYVNGKYRCQHNISSGDITTVERRGICNLFIGNNRYTTSCNCNTSCCKCCNDG